MTQYYALAHLFLYRSLSWMTNFRWCKFLYSLFCAWLLAYLVQLKSDSHLPKKIICCNDSLSKILKNAFYFILKALFILKIFKFLSWHFGHVEKMAWLEELLYFRNLCSHHSLVYKELQDTYCSTCHKLKATRQWNLVS